MALLPGSNPKFSYYQIKSRLFNLIIANNKGKIMKLNKITYAQFKLRYNEIKHYHAMIRLSIALYKRIAKK